MKRRTTTGHLALRLTVAVVAAILADRPGGTSEAAVRVPQSIFQFGDMIKATTGRKALLYNNYGNYCGRGNNRAPPVDQVDRCCQIHDDCYGELSDGPCGTTLLGTVFAQYVWSVEDKTVTCGPGSTCRQQLCACDRDAANCFARHPYNETLKRASVWDWLL